MSLIFEALKKLDREKKAPERGFLVVGGSHTAGERRLRVPVLVLLLAAAGAGGFLAARATRSAPAPEVPPPSTPPSTAAHAATVPRLTAPAPLSPEAAERPTTVEPPSAAGPPAPAREPSAPRTAAAAAAPPALAPAAAAPAFALQAVTERDGQPVAIVNGQLVRVGDRVDGARVVRIAPEEVELEQDGRRLVLSF